MARDKNLALTLGGGAESAPLPCPRQRPGCPGGGGQGPRPAEPQVPAQSVSGWPGPSTSVPHSPACVSSPLGTHVPPACLCPLPSACPSPSPVFPCLSPCHLLLAPVPPLQSLSPPSPAQPLGLPTVQNRLLEEGVRGWTGVDCAQVLSQPRRIWAGRAGRGKRNSGMERGLPGPPPSAPGLRTG